VIEHAGPVPAVAIVVAAIVGAFVRARESVERLSRASSAGDPKFLSEKPGFDGRAVAAGIDTYECFEFLKTGARR
jgi:hypothetical protein